MAEDQALDLLDIDLEEEEADRKAKRAKIFVIIVLFLLVIGAGAAIAHFMGLFDQFMNDGTEEAVDEAPPPPLEPQFLELEPIVTNLDGGGANSLLKIAITLVYTDKKDLLTLEQMEPRIMNILQVYVRDVRMDDLRSSEGLNPLRRVLLERINAAVRPARVESILIKNFLIQ